MIDLEAVVEVNPYHLISEVVQTSSNHVAEVIEQHLPDPQRTLLDERACTPTSSYTSRGTRIWLLFRRGYQPLSWSCTIWRLNSSLYFLECFWSTMSGLPFSLSKSLFELSHSL